MRFLFVFLIVYICEQATATIYQCNSSATCGCSSSSSTVLSRIVGGEDAIQGSWSWAVSLRYYGSHFCGGSVLSPFLIITAAHCIHDIGNTAIVTIVAGSIGLDTSSSNKFYQNRSIAQIYKHPNYDPLTLSNDLALLRLSSPLNITNGNGYIKPICLPTGTTVQPLDNIDMIAVGWGFTSMYSNTVSSTLQQVTVKSIPSELKECSRLVFNSQLQFCAGILTGGKDTCQGDSGGPIMTFVNGMWELHGLTSYGYGCALPTYPGVYTRVSYYVNWIKSIIQLYESTTVTPTKKTTTNIITATTRTTRKTTSKKSTLNTQKEIVSNTTNYNSTKANFFTESLFKTSHATRYSINQSFIYTFFFGNYDWCIFFLMIL